MEYRVLMVKAAVVEADSGEEAKEKALEGDVKYETYDAVLTRECEEYDVFEAADYMLEIASDILTKRMNK